MTRHLRRLGNQFSVSLPTDDEGYLGRECEKCRSYFKIVPGTGLAGISTCLCPYCGHKAEQSDFATQVQNDYAKSIMTQKVMGAVSKDLKDMARSFNRKFSGGLLSLKMSVTSRPTSIRQYVEKELETRVECNACTLKYAIYGVFGFCPDCGAHNSLQILEKNLELAKKGIALAENNNDEDLKSHLVGDALENAVSAFDGFGRQVVAASAAGSLYETQAAKLTFQNLDATDSRLSSIFGFTLHDGVTIDEWTLLVRCFQKRHLLAHKMGVVDEKYLAATGDRSAIVGRKAGLTAVEVTSLIDAVAKLAAHLVVSLGTHTSDSK